MPSSELRNTACFFSTFPRYPFPSSSYVITIRYLLEKIIAWCGPASIQHIKGMVGPGIDLITLDPKFSISIIGEEAFQSEATMRHVASLGAVDSSTLPGVPQDALELMRRACKWIMDEINPE